MRGERENPRLLFLLKIAVTPVLVAAVSLAARWWGPGVGGILMGLPWFTGPTLYILVLDHGIEFGVAACAGVLIGVACVAAFTLAYGLAAKFAGWPLSLAAAVAVFLAGAWAAGDPAILAHGAFGAAGQLWAAAGAGAASLAVALALLPRPRIAALPQALPWWDIPARMVATAALVSVLVVGADTLGPRLAGVFSTYPVILTVVGSFTHHCWGRDAVWRMFRGVMASMFGFVLFFLVVGLALPRLGLAAAYALASATALAVTAGLFAFNRGGQKVPAPSRRSWNWRFERRR
jgi:hypothetical protein